MFYENLIGKINTKKQEWLSLKIHLEDTANIAKLLTEKWLSKSCIINSCLSEREYSDVMYILGYLHDLGKATIAFQSKIVMKANKILKDSLLEDVSLYNETRNFSHARGGEAIALQLGMPNGLASVLGAHHSVPQEMKDRNDSIERDIQNYPDNYYASEDKEEWDHVWQQVASDALKPTMYNSLSELPVLNEPTLMIMWGLLIMADWIASNENYFPLISTDTNEINGSIQERAMNGWKQASLTLPWISNIETYDDPLFENVYGFKPNELQKTATDIASKSENLGLMIIEAPMGVGKTETALAVAEILNTKYKKGGLVFALPTQATANGLYPRLLSWGEKQSKDTLHSIKLAHGAAVMNEQYRKLIEGSKQSNTSTGLEVNDWFNNRKTGLLADFVISTVDQILRASLKEKHLCFRHLGLANKIVIIDEVHSYDAYMDVYLERTLQWLSAEHVPVILLSATLTAEKRKTLVESYANKKDIEVNVRGWDTSLGYPLVTWTDNRCVNQKEIKYKGSNKQVKINKIENEDVVARLKDKLSEGGCAAIFKNTVSSAQELYDELEATGYFDRLILFHSRFTMRDRQYVEQSTLNMLGKNSKEQDRNSQRTVIVGTQVIEQSLDIDADYIITDLCPMDLLLQRIGRLQRHDRGYRLDKVKNPTCDVIVSENYGSEAIYTKCLLDRTKCFLKDVINIPSDIPELVNETYDINNHPEISDSKQFDNRIALKEQKAEAYLLRAPSLRVSGRKTLHDFLKNQVDDFSLKAVRDGQMPLRVILLKENDDEYTTLDNKQIDLSREISDKVAFKLLRDKVSLPDRLLDDKYGLIDSIEQNKRVFNDFLKGAFPLKNENILLLDKNGELKIKNATISYDDIRGLTVTYKSNENV